MFEGMWPELIEALVRIFTSKLIYSSSPKFPPVNSGGDIYAYTISLSKIASHFIVLLEMLFLEVKHNELTSFSHQG